MVSQINWAPVEINSESTNGFSLDDIASGNVPALIFRQVYSSECCEEIYKKLLEAGLLYDPNQGIPEKFLEASIPEGYYREGKQGIKKRAWESKLADGKRRIDVGTSLGYRGSEPDKFFAHARETQHLFANLFEGMLSPVTVLYDCLQRLAPEKHVQTAHEADGRTYGPAIIRAHYGGYSYRPHFDSVRLRERREEYIVSQFTHQFAGVLVLKNSTKGGDSAQCVLHQCFWEPEIQTYLDSETFHDYAATHDIKNCKVHLEPGDLYFFNTRAIHEVPGLDGKEPRVVVATFIGYSPEQEDIFVWS